MKELSDDFIASLDKKPREDKIEHILTWIFPEGGPIRQHNKEMKCSNIHLTGKQCKKPTFMFLNMKPTCQICAIRLMNQRIIELENPS